MRLTLTRIYNEKTSSEKFSHLAMAQWQQSERAGQKTSGHNINRELAEKKWCPLLYASGLAFWGWLLQPKGRSDLNWFPINDFLSTYYLQDSFFIKLKRGLSNRSRLSHALHRISKLEEIQEHLGKLFSKYSQKATTLEIIGTVKNAKIPGLIPDPLN